MARAPTFESFIRKERSRLEKARKAAQSKKATIDQELQSVERELRAIESYERTKGGKPERGRRMVRRTVHRAGGRRGEKRQTILELIRKSPEGLTRAEVLSQLGIKGDKSGEQSVSNALSALKKAGKLSSREGKYVVA